MEVLADKNNDRTIKLPIIAIRRSTGFTITNPNKKPLTFDGLALDDQLMVEYDGVKTKWKNKEMTDAEYQMWLKEHQEVLLNEKIASLNAIPIRLEYYLDVYTRYQKENDMYMRNLIFNIVNYPTFQIRFNYNSIPVEHNSNIILGDRVTTDTPNIKLFSDQICRQTLTISIDDAYLWDTRLYSSVSISDAGMTVEIYDVDRNDFIIEHI